jgi:mannose/fructose/N-acetylgalactosamine-specific phosphotransferase system component IIB
MDDVHWDHLRSEPTAKFLYENCNETFTWTLAHQIKSVIDQKRIDPSKIFIIVMDEVHKNFLDAGLNELNIQGINVGVYNKLMTQTQIPEVIPLTEKKFSALSRNYRSWRLHVYAKLAENNLLKDFKYSFYNIFPYGEVKYYDQETLLKDLKDTNFGEITSKVLDWISKVPYTLDATDNVLNKWGDVTYDAILSADFHLLIETHYDLFYYVPTKDRVYRRNLAPSSITEKTNKPIACCKPFIAFSTPYFLEDVRHLGFETFSPYINESYDLETDNQKRLNMIVDEIKRITNLSADEYTTLVENCHSIAVRNQQKLLSKKDNLQYNEKFNFLRDYFEPQSNIQIL